MYILILKKTIHLIKILGIIKLHYKSNIKNKKPNTKNLKYFKITKKVSKNQSRKQYLYKHFN
jgi:hypothetical protein